jgi:hypothetical protein
MPKIKASNHEEHPELNMRTHLTGQAKKNEQIEKLEDRNYSFRIAARPGAMVTTTRC